MEVSIVIPVYNEEDNLPILYDELYNVLNKEVIDYEIIFVNDGSTDNSLQILKGIAKSNEKVKVISFTRNFGQSAAMNIGIKYSRGDIIVFLDSDLQNNPRDIPIFIQKIKEGYDIVVGWRQNRKDPFFTKVLPSKIANFIIRKITRMNIHDFGCTLKAFKKEAITNINLYGELHRFIAALAIWNNNSYIEVPVEHRPRKYGKSKYNLFRTFKVILDVLNISFIKGYKLKPSYIFGGIGLIFLAIGFVFFLITAYRVLILKHLEATPVVFLMVVFFSGGIQAIFIGLLAELIINLHLQQGITQTAEIKELINFKDGKNV